MYYLLLYDVVPDYAERRTPFRPEHLALVRAHYDRGELVMAGPFGDPVDGVEFVFKVDDASIVERFARADPYVKNGVATAWRVRPWTLVFGGDTPPPG